MEIEVYHCYGRICRITTAGKSKEIRGYHDQYGLLEEMADAYICLNFLESIFNISPEEIQKAIDVKLYREKGNLK